MDSKLDQTKGSAKEAAGVPMDDDRLKNEGKLDQVARKVKGKAERVKGKLAQAVETMKAALAAKNPYRPAK